MENLLEQLQELLEMIEGDLKGLVIDRISAREYAQNLQDEVKSTIENAQ